MTRYFLTNARGLIPFTAPSKDAMTLRSLNLWPSEWSLEASRAVFASMILYSRIETSILSFVMYIYGEGRNVA